MPLPRALARFNRRATNRVLGRLADVTSPWAWVEHRGRRSGSVYRTPVWVWHTESGYLIALTYGRETEWLKNVVAAGGCKIEQRGRSVSVGNPRIVGLDSALSRLPRLVRPLMRVVRVKHWLLLDR